MKKSKSGTYSGRMTRRQFVGRALAAGLVSGAPAFLRGQNLNNKLNIAFIACGGWAEARLGWVALFPGRKTGAGGVGGGTGPGGGRSVENGLHICDVDG